MINLTKQTKKIGTMYYALLILENYAQWLQIKADKAKLFCSFRNGKLDQFMSDLNFID
jgi:hypothetical protein